VWLERLGVAGRATARVDELSHGNQQRVQLIAALVSEPDLLVLDEPFSGLDPIAMSVMADLLEELAGTGVTVLFSSHQLDLVEDLCEDVVIIEQGRVVLAGELQALRAATPQRVVDIRYRGPVPRWSGLPGVQVLESTDGSVRLKVPRDTEIPALLARMTGHDEVTSFSYQPPTLSDLFTEAVRT
jgi:ABC-2 type transport system ATP-binding protein